MLRCIDVMSACKWENLLYYRMDARVGREEKQAPSCSSEALGFLYGTRMYHHILVQIYKESKNSEFKLGPLHHYEDLLRLEVYSLFNDLIQMLKYVDIGYVGT